MPSSRLHQCWYAMMRRCYWEGHSAFPNYGGRGIGVCEQWHDASRFQDWALANGYAEHLQIDRIDNDKGYSPENCRWVTVVEQRRNQRRQRVLTALGETKPLIDWVADERCRVSFSALCHRIEAGWEPDDVVLLAEGERQMRYECFGERKTLREWAQDGRCVCGHETLRARVQRDKWPLERALTRVPRKASKRHKAFGMENTLREWSTDKRCRVNFRTLKSRVYNYRWPVEAAITTPVGGKRPKGQG